MALPYLVVGGANTNVAFQTRIQGALAAQCIVVNSESAGTANHVQRLQLMGRVLANPVTYAAQMAPIIASVPPINAEADLTVPTDADILSGVAAIWDAFALRGL